MQLEIPKMYSANEAYNFQKPQELKSCFILNLNANFHLTQKIAYSLLLLICGSLFIHQLILCVDRLGIIEEKLQYKLK